MYFTQHKTPEAIAVLEADLKKLTWEREGVCLLDLNLELVPEKRGLIAEGSAPQTHFGDPRNYK